MDETDTHDGFFLLPGDDGEEHYSVKLKYFNFPTKFKKGKKIDGSKMGDMYHVALFETEDGLLPELTDQYEAIFADPEVYIKALVGLNIFGCFVKKTENSSKWFKNYIKDTKNDLKKLRKELHNGKE